MLFPASVPGQAVRKALQSGQILFSQASVAELLEILNRPKFDRYLTPEDRQKAVLVLVKNAEQVVITQSIVACRDPKDNIVLELAVNDKADMILTGNQDLLIMKSFQGLPIWTAAVYLAH